MESPEVALKSNPTKLRTLAAWYRNLAEATENPAIWEGRRQTAHDLEEKAARAEGRMPLQS
jgi:hypothetical protein